MRAAACVVGGALAFGAVGVGYAAARSALTSATSSAAEPTIHPVVRASGSPRPVISIDAARRVARHWFLRRDPARVHDNDAALARLETGMALTVDRGFTSWISCGCETPKHRHRLVRVHVVSVNSVDRTFLAQFAVRRLDNGFPGVYDVVFTKQQGWRAAVIALNARELRLLPTDDSGRAAPSASAASRELTDLAAYWMGWRVEHHRPRTAPASFDGFADAIGAQFSEKGQDYTDPRTGIVRHHVMGSDTTAYGFALPNGTVVCGAVDDYVTAHIPGADLYQPPSQSNFGTMLAPGTYRRLLERHDYETCVVNQGHRDVLSAYGTMVSIRP